MLMVSLLDAHSSSPLKIYKDLKALALRKDLYTGDDFYFGFDSSNHNFLDIIGGHQPLAIKHGPMLSLYRQGVDGYSYDAYYIDVNTKTLLPVINITAKPSDSATFTQMLPWSFIDFYLKASEPSVSEKETVAKETKPSSEQMIQAMLEQLATSRWPEVRALSQLPSEVIALKSRVKDLEITLADLPALKQKVQDPVKKAGSNDFIAHYNPFFDNSRISIDFLKSSNPKQITVRKINDKYPRIEIIAPELPVDKHFSAVYESRSPAIYKSFQDCLGKPEEVTELLKEHFPEVLAHYSTPTIMPGL